MERKHFLVRDNPSKVATFGRSRVLPGDGVRYGALKIQHVALTALTNPLPIECLHLKYKWRLS